MKILFTHSYFLRFDPKQWKTGQPYAPLGTLLAAAFLRQNGCNISFFDTMFSKSADEIIAQLETMQPDVFVIYDDGFNYLTKMCLTNMREAAFKMCETAKKYKCKVVVSSSDATDNFEKYLAKGADFVLIGEAEHTLLDLAATLKKGETHFSKIPGLAYIENGETVKTPKRNVIKDLDSLPFPAWDLIDIEPYRKMWLASAGYFSLNMSTTRGCPFKCNWCAKPIYGNHYNSRSPQHVVEELKLLQSIFGYEHIWFCDDIFGLKSGWLNDFADLVEKENLHFRYKIQSRADLLLKEENIKALARSGCENVWIGAESGSQTILDAMDKGITIAQIYEATNLLKLHQIKPSFFIQFGYLGETKQDIEKTIKMINTLLPHSIGVSVSYPLPGTKFYKKVKEELQEKTNWTDSDELKLMFSNTYQPAFYKQLHKYVQRNYRKSIALHTTQNMLKGSAGFTYINIRKSASLAYLLPLVFIDKLKLQALEKAN
ncbi:MAG: B12-binding domain-containing radical SAM protein [Bacteroidia bacterium]